MLQTFALFSQSLFNFQTEAWYVYSFIIFTLLQYSSIAIVVIMVDWRGCALVVSLLVEGHTGEDGEDEEDWVIQDPGHPLAPAVEADTLAENADNSGQVEERYQHHRGNHCGLVESQKRWIL